MDNKKKTLTVISLVTLAVVMYMCWDLFEQIVMISIDDVMYSDWTKHGFQYFIDKNIWHYQNFNGRAFIHLMMQLVTFFDEHLYAILFPIMLGTITYLFTTIVKKNWELHKRLFAVALSIMLFLGLSHFYLSQVLWIAGGFNYVFPLFVISIFYFLYLKYRRTTKTIWWLLPFALLCGATTEQYGMYTIGLIAMTAFFDLIDTQKICRNDLLCLGGAIAGLVSVFLSPATFSRLGASNEKIASESMSFLQGYLNNFNYIGGKYGLIILPVLFMLIIGLCALSKKETYSKWMLLGLPCSVVAFFTGLFGLYWASALVSTACVIIVMVTMLMKKETRELGKVFVCGFGTFFMMSITLAAGNRTCIPCILSFVVALSIMLVDILSGKNKKVLNIIMVIVVMIGCLNNYWTTYDGYKAKSVWCQEMYDQLMVSNETGKLEIYFDELVSSPEPKYRYVTMFDVADRNQFGIFQSKFNTPDDVKIYITSDKYDVSNVCVGNRYALLPAVKQDGQIYIPICAAYDKDIGFNIQETSNKTLLILGGGTDIIECEPKDSIGIMLYNGGRRFIEINLFCNHYGLEYTYDPVENTYIFTSIK